jgi:oligopeptide/dipeptide ABC transporter ATP-binding protein
MTTLLEISNLSVDLFMRERSVRLVDQVTLSVAAGEAVGLVGESGSGKSLTAFSVLGLFPAQNIRVAGGSIRLDGVDLRALSTRDMQAIRGRRIGIVFQDPSAYLDPLMPVGQQIGEVFSAHGVRDNIARRVADLLDMVELPDPSRLARRYPHQLSGGQRQRVLIAAALALRPKLLIADEPTTALDVTVQAGILALLGRLRAEMGLGILLITHDLGVVAQHCRRVFVMYAGRVVETNTVSALFAAPRHPYTAGLLKSTLAVDGFSDDLFSIPGRVPTSDAMPVGCRFHPRCPIALPDPCETKSPPLLPRPGGGADACWRSDESQARDPWRSAHAA